MRSKDNLVGLVHSFHLYLGSRDGTLFAKFMKHEPLPAKQCCCPHLAFGYHNISDILEQLDQACVKSL